MFQLVPLTSEAPAANVATQTLPLPQGGYVGHESAGEITKLLQGWRDGDRKALDALVPIVYKELHRIAHFQLRHFGGLNFDETAEVLKVAATVARDWTTA